MASRALVELIDLYPTLVEACGKTPPQGLEGSSLMPLIHGPSKPGKKAVYTMVGRNDDRNESHKKPAWFGRSVRTDRYRYTEWDGGKRGVELYDHETNPGETINLAADPKLAAVVAELKALLRLSA